MVGPNVFPSILYLAIFTIALPLTLAYYEDYEMPTYEDHPCVRECEDNGLPRLCKYNWVIENYYVMSKACFDCPFNLSDCFRPHCVPGDGYRRGIKVANRMLPGPGIQVCEGDTIEVQVYNRMEAAEGTAIHWHGLLQNGTQYMDGAAMVTQCPIASHTKFTYRFKADNAGTHYWHAHAGVQRSDGLFGSLIVRQPPSREPTRLLYDFDLPEHVIIINDWFNEMTLVKFARHHHYEEANRPTQMLINGMGQYQEYAMLNDTAYFTPRAEFTVERGKRYRFRVISSTMMNCPIQVSVDNHTLMVIASDGNSFDPFVTDSIILYGGERYDFVLYADKPIGNYWIRSKGLILCTIGQASQAAILRYKGAPTDEMPKGGTSWDESGREGIVLNPLNEPSTDQAVYVSRMRADAPDDDTMTAVPDRKYYMAMDFYKIDNHRFNNPKYYPLSAVDIAEHVYSPQINHISFLLPSAPPLTELDNIPKDMFCNAETVQKHCDKEFCECLHLYKVDVGDLVELIIIDEGNTFDASHPMHLHGYKYRVVGMGKLGSGTTLEEVKAMDARGELNRTTSQAPLKDTVVVPDGGYTIIRFRADNPGIWFFHCHFQFHLEAGMALLFQVGDKEQFPPVPKDFPTCSNWDFHGFVSNKNNNDKNVAMQQNGNHNSGNDNNDYNNSCRNTAMQNFVKIQTVVSCTCIALIKLLWFL